jgi:ribosomal protein S18 acetylase RimI-like enzyme
MDLASQSQARPAPPPPPTVRTAHAADREAIAALIGEDALFDAVERAVALELVDDALAARTADYELLVATDGRELLGYVCFGPTPMTTGTYDLYWIITRARHRGRGVARTLVAEMERVLRERRARLVRVETSKLEGYGAARAFYGALGYPIASVLPDFYRPGDDLIVYLKQL